MPLKRSHNILLFIVIIFGIVSCSKDKADNITAITVSTANFSMNVDENPIAGQLIGVVTGSTNQGAVTFTITDQTPNGAIAIDSSTGGLTVANELLFDFEVNPTITAVVKVANGTITDNSMITITLNDLIEENIYEGDVIFSSQSQVDDFGVNNYTEITGYLLIGNSQNQITNLSSLSSLTTIGGTLFIGYSATNLSGLGIISVGEYLRIESNPFITNINELSSIASVGGGIYIQSNSALINIDGLSSITAISGEIKISNNNQLSDVNGLQNISEGVSEITISSNPQLTQIDGLNNINSVEGNTTVGYNESLNNINGLSNLSHVGTNLSISRNPLISDLMSLNNLSYIGENLRINENNLLTDLCGLQYLLINDGLIGTFVVSDNAYNPSQQDIIDGNCSL